MIDFCVDSAQKSIMSFKKCNVIMTSRAHAVRQPMLIGRRATLQLMLEVTDKYVYMSSKDFNVSAHLIRLTWAFLTEQCYK